MKRGISGYILSGITALSLANVIKASPITINEFVVDPQVDRYGAFNNEPDGNITSSDEYFELFNSGNEDVNLTGWRLDLIDTTFESESLEGMISSEGFFVVSNPVGAQNNNGALELYDSSNNLVDRVIYGDWEGGNGIPDGNSNTLEDESLSRFGDGSDNWIKTVGTPGSNNVPEPSSGLALVGFGGYCVSRRKRRKGK